MSSLTKVLGFLEEPKGPFRILKTVRRVNFGTGTKFGTDVAKRYGEGSEVLVFLGKRVRKNGTDTEKLRRWPRIARYRETISAIPP